MNSVTVYTTTQYPYCVMLKNFLSEQNINFKEVNVETQPEIMEQLLKITGQMDVMGLDWEVFIDGTEIGGVVTFLEWAKDADVA